MGKLNIETQIASFRQADLLAKSFDPRIAAKHREFRERERSAYSKGPSAGGAIQGFKNAILVAQACENQRLVEGIYRRSGSHQFFRVLPAARAPVGITKFAANLATRCY